MMDDLQENEQQERNPPQYEFGVDYGYTPNTGHPSKQAWYSSSHDDPPPPYESVSPRFTVFNIFTHRPVREETIVRNLQEQPKDYLIYAILVTIFCCLPCGIVAIIKAMKVRRSLAAGDIDGALVSESRAKQWCIVSLLSGLTLYGVILFSGLLNSGRVLQYIYV